MIWEQEQGKSSDALRRYKPVFKKKQHKILKPVFIPFDVLKQTLSGYEKNVFIQNLLSRVAFPFCIDEVENTISMYRLGTLTNGYRTGANTFPFIDTQNNVRAIQVKQFDETNHTKGTDFLHSIIEKHHARNNKPLPEWLKAYQNNEIKVSCLFGAHNLNKYPHNPIALVEAPKTAIYCTLYFGFPEQATKKNIRNNLKKLGCLFEAFIGAMFLDFNRIMINDEDGWFRDIFIAGPGFQMVQVFVENVFEKHVDWISLIQNDDNYKNILQVKIQKEFKVTPNYLEINEHNTDTGYHMGVYLCLGQQIHNVLISSAIPIAQFKSYSELHQYMSEKGKILVFLGEGVHKIKKKAEQISCESAIHNLSGF